MTKQSGLGDGLLIGGIDLSGDTGSLGRIGGGPNALELTGIDKSAFERRGGLRDGGLGWSSWFNPEVLIGAHPVLSALPRTDVIVTYLRGRAIGSPACSCIAKQISYDPTRGQDGSLTIAVETLPNGYGLEWGRQLTAGIIQHAGPDETASLDQVTASTLFGWQAWLQVNDFDGTDATFTLEDSANNTDWVALTGGAFTQVTTAPQAQRLQGARDATVRRYVRVATTGTFTTVDFTVVFVRNDTLVVF